MAWPWGAAPTGRSSLPNHRLHTRGSSVYTPFPALYQAAIWHMGAICIQQWLDVFSCQVHPFKGGQCSGRGQINCECHSSFNPLSLWRQLFFVQYRTFFLSDIFFILKKHPLKTSIFQCIWKGQFLARVPLAPEKFQKGQK